MEECPLVKVQSYAKIEHALQKKQKYACRISTQRTISSVSKTDTLAYGPLLAKRPWLLNFGFREAIHRNLPGW
jgi:hypothetical protein